jgi:DNA-binding MarR family transcriptional regulator
MGNMAAPRWLNETEMLAWRSFITTSGDLIRTIEKDLERFGLDFGDYQLLVMLSEAPGHRLRMCDLADTLRLSRSGLTRRMQGVVKMKLVARTQSKEDARSALAQLTPKGMALLRKAAPHHVESVRRQMIDLLTESEAKAIGSAFTKIGRHLDAQNRGQ